MQSHNSKMGNLDSPKKTLSAAIGDTRFSFYLKIAAAMVAIIPIIPIVTVTAIGFDNTIAAAIVAITPIMPTAIGFNKILFLFAK